MKYGVLFAIAAVLLLALALIQGGWRLILLWPAVSFGIVASGYLHFGPIVYGKSRHGLLSAGSQMLLLPYLVYLWSVWFLLRCIKQEPAFNQLTDTIFIGRRLLSHELPDNIDHVVDLTCEFNEPTALRSRSYRSFPILDGFVPSPEQLRQWTEHVAALSGNVYIHCAEGHGRTGLFAAALLLTIGHSATADAALQFIKSKRPMVRLRSQQTAFLITLDKAK